MPVESFNGKYGIVKSSINISLSQLHESDSISHTLTQRLVFYDTTGLECVELYVYESYRLTSSRL